MTTQPQPDICDYIRDYLAELLPRLGITQGEIQQLADQLERHLRAKFGANQHYIHAPSRAERNRRIHLLRQSGHSTQEIAKIVGVNRTTVIRVLRKSRSHEEFAPSDWAL